MLPDFHRLPGIVHCYLCTHRVSAHVLVPAKVLAAKLLGSPLRATGREKTQPGQHCPRCHASLDSAYVLELQPPGDGPNSTTLH